LESPIKIKVNFQALAIEDLAVFHQEHACQMIGDVTFGSGEGIDP